MPSTQAIVPAAIAALALCIGAGQAAAAKVDNFEGGLPVGTDGDGIVLGFYGFQGSGAPTTITTTLTPPAVRPGSSAGNAVLQMDVDTDTFSGFVHVFENAGATALAPRDWSAYGRITFWVHGNGTGNELFIDVLDNRSPGGGYPFELWTATFNDDFSGWKKLKISFGDLARKEIGNGAPNDGLGLTSVHGWALGTLGTNGPKTYYVDDVRVVSSVPEPASLALLGAGLCMVAGTAYFRRSR